MASPLHHLNEQWQESSHTVFGLSEIPHFQAVIIIEVTRSMTHDQHKLHTAWTLETCSSLPRTHHGGSICHSTGGERASVQKATSLRCSDVECYRQVSTLGHWDFSVGMKVDYAIIHLLNSM